MTNLAAGDTLSGIQRAWNQTMEGNTCKGLTLGRFNTEPTSSVPQTKVSGSLSRR